jgi:glyoxylase-like metal-dependent hydrolase (beta-lactamase superfamily II)
MVVSIVENVARPAGVAGPQPLAFDTRCFLVAHSGGVVLVDAGMQTGAQPVEEALTGMGAGWDAVSDIVVTHAHPDHVGGLPAVVSRAPSAAVWAGPDEPLA